MHWAGGPGLRGRSGSHRAGVGLPGAALSPVHGHPQTLHEAPQLVSDFSCFVGVVCNGPGPLLHFRWATKNPHSAGFGCLDAEITASGILIAGGKVWAPQGIARSSSVDAGVGS